MAAGVRAVAGALWFSRRAGWGGGPPRSRRSVGPGTDPKDRSPTRLSDHMAARHRSISKRAGALARRLDAVQERRPWLAFPVAVMRKFGRSRLFARSTDLVLHLLLALPVAGGAGHGDGLLHQRSAGSTRSEERRVGSG